MVEHGSEEGACLPLRLIARDAVDLTVIAALTQDAHLTGADLCWLPRKRRFGLLLGRHRREVTAMRTPAGEQERIRSLLVFDDVLRVAHRGLSRGDAQQNLALLTLHYVPEAQPTEVDAPAGPGRVRIVFDQGAAVELTVECLEVMLTDLSREL